jgi:hypothetical protein
MGTKKLIGMGVCVVLAFVLAVLSITADGLIYMVYLMGAALLGVAAGLIKNAGSHV